MCEEQLHATLLAAGEDSALPSFIAERQAETQELKSRLEETHSVLDRVVDHMDRLPPKQRQTAEALMAQAKQAQSRVRAIEREIDELVEQAEQLAVKRIRIVKVVHPGVTLRIASVALTVRDTVPGPVAITLNSDNDGLEFKSG